MEERRFRASVTGEGRRVFILLPFDPDQVWGQRLRHDLTGSIGGRDYRGKVERTLAGPILSLGPAWRRDSGIHVGDEVEVVLRPEGPQVPTMDADLREAFEANPEARRVFEGLSTHHRKEYMRWIEEARRPETRARRIAEMMRMLYVDTGGKHPTD